MRSPLLIVTAPGRVEPAEYDVPAPGPDDLLVRAALTAVSPGTELRAMAGMTPGDPPYVPGYALVGEVVDAGPDARGRVGERVFGGGARAVAPFRRQWGGHVAHAVDRADRWHRVPDGVPDGLAVLAKLAAVALHGLSMAGVGPGDRVAVLGLGVIGQLSARLAAAAGARVDGFDRSPARVALAAGFPARAVGADPVADADAYRRETGGADVAIDATGVPAAFDTTVALSRELPWPAGGARGPRLVVQGSYAGDGRYDYDAAFGREATILLPRDNTPGDVAEVLAAMASGRLAPAGLEPRRFAPADAADAYRLLASPDCDALTLAFDWRAGA